jgi:hypothetical protein
MEEVIRSNEKTVVVLGRDRGGTSVVAGILDVIGVDMSADSNPTPFNPHGAYEDLDFNIINEEIIKTAGGDSIYNLPTYEDIIGTKSLFEERIQKLFEKKSKAHIWGWKKPSTSLLIELYLPYLNNPHMVVVFRNILGNAKSMVNFTRHKEKISIHKAMTNAIFTYQMILDFLDRHPELPVLFIAFEDIIQDPVKESQKIAEFVGLDLNEDKIKKICEFIIPANKIDAEKNFAFYISIPRKFIRMCQKIVDDPLNFHKYLTQAIKLSINTIFRR